MLAKDVSETLGGASPAYRWQDVMEGNIDTRTAEEVVNDVIKNAGLEVI